MVKRAMSLGMLVCLGLALGCQATPVQKWAAGGAVVGAGVGVLAGQGDQIANSALLGGAGGGLAGALAADVYQHTDERAAVAAELNAKDAENAALAEKERAASRKLEVADADLKTKDRAIEGLTKANADLTAELANCKGSRVEITLTADVLFKPGSCVLSAKGKAALNDAIKQLKDSTSPIMVEGHTDSDPIKASSWKSNWELGSARALAVLHYMIDKGGMEASRFAATTFSKYQPVGDEKAKNRRAVIVLYTGWPSKRY